MTYQRPVIVPGQTRRNDAFYENIFDGIDEASENTNGLTIEEADDRYAQIGGAALPPGGSIGQVVGKTAEGGDWIDQPTVDTLPGASTLGRSIMKAATSQLIREIAETPSLEDVEPINFTLAFENALA